MILLDTNICIYIINARPPEVLAHFHRYRLGDIGISSVVAAELAYGVAKSQSRRNRAALVSCLTNSFTYLTLQTALPGSLH
jgi:tRNA(fMet)-specific endonuclease VapC